MGSISPEHQIAESLDVHINTPSHMTSFLSHPVGLMLSMLLFGCGLLGSSSARQSAPQTSANQTNMLTFTDKRVRVRFLLKIAEGMVDFSVLGFVGSNVEK